MAIPLNLTPPVTCSICGHPPQTTTELEVCDVSSCGAHVCIDCRTHNEEAGVYNCVWCEQEARSDYVHTQLGRPADWTPSPVDPATIIYARQTQNSTVLEFESVLSDALALADPKNVNLDELRALEDEGVDFHPVFIQHLDAAREQVEKLIPQLTAAFTMASGALARQHRYQSAQLEKRMGRTA